MYKSLMAFGKQILTLTRDVQQNKQDIREIREDVQALREDLMELQREVANLTAVVASLITKVEHHRELAQKDREYLIAQMEIRLLRAERGLPPPTGESPSSTDES